MDLRWSSPKDSFPVRELMTYQRSSNFTWESIRDRILRRLCSKASQPLTSLYPFDREVSDAVPTLVSGFKFHRVRDD
ncbi:hypothetical protein TNCV_330831 [Trichonephila clavipes]|nr:hypothetical protein TNCV_330831 [Trichonephila clavipes]